MNKELIKQLALGKIAVRNDGSLEELRQVLKEAFPKDDFITEGTHKNYILSDDEDFWDAEDFTNLPSYSVKEFLKEETMENKKLIGYKVPYDLWGGQIKKGSIYITHPPNNYGYRDNMIEEFNIAKEIVEQWEPVYEEKFKVGDWVTVIQEEAGFNGKLGQTYKIFGWQENYKNRFYFTEGNKGKSINISKVKVRLATKDEIEKATIKLPTINGHLGKVDGDLIVYGSNCAKFSIRNIADLSEDISSFNNPDKDLKNYHGGNRKIVSVKLDSGVEITVKQLDEIWDYIVNKGL